jgi:hypothetical protein
LVERSYAHMNKSRSRSSRFMSYTPSTDAVYQSCDTPKNVSKPRLALCSGQLASRQDVRLLQSAKGYNSNLRLARVMPTFMQPI